MEQKDFDIHEILKGVPAGTKLYTKMCGNVELTYIALNKEFKGAILVKNKTGEYTFNKNGRFTEGGEVMLFPSYEMRDWSKFAWKKGDILVNGDKDVHIIFEAFENDTYTRFKGKHYLWKEGDEEDYSKEETFMLTSVFEKANDDDTQTYINNINKCFGGKLNRETLEIEKPAKPVFELGNLYVFNEEDEDGELTIIGNLIGKNESEDTLTFGNQYEIENEKFVTDQAFDLRISVHEELREATEGEAVTFQEACTLWEKSKKQGEEQSPFKPLDKVLVRYGEKCKWLPAFFIRVNEGFSGLKCSVFLISSGKVSYFTSCIPFEGNEHLAFTDKDFKDLPF